MKQYRVFLSDTAFRDINDTVSYIANELLEPHTAKQLLERLLDAINALVDSPYRHKVIECVDLVLVPIHMCQTGNYLIFYTINDSDRCVDIIRVLYGRRDWQALLL